MVLSLYFIFPNSGKPHRIKIHVHLSIAQIAFGPHPHTHSNGKFVLKIFNLGGPKMCKGNVIWTRWASSNGHSLETKRDFFDQLVPKYSYRVDQGFHPLFHESDPAPLSHPRSTSFLKKTLFWGVPGFRIFQKLVRICPQDACF